MLCHTKNDLELLMITGAGATRGVERRSWPTYVNHRR